MSSSELIQVKPDFIGALVKNQTNLRLINLLSSHIDSSKTNMKKKGMANEPQVNKTVGPLSIFALLAEPD